MLMGVCYPPADSGWFAVWGFVMEKHKHSRAAICVGVSWEKVG